MRTSVGKLTLVLASLAITAAHAEVRYVAADTSKATELCVSAATDSRIQFYVRAHESGYSMRSIANNTTCNGASIVEFGQQAGNINTAAYLRKYDNGAGSVEVKSVSDAASRGDSVSVAANTGVTRIIFVKGK